MEELRVQAALGKAEAKDAIDEARRKFNHYMHDAGVEFEEAKAKVSGKADEWKADFEELQLQFSLGKAEARDAINEQMKRIQLTMQHIEAKIREKIH